ncbi:type VI secretion system protein [Thermomonas flagellata]|uniref:type VI secretion system protein n=1 Tax=Thermomonas flagellata TaxID=2888524 RepID=UPI001F0459B7|nr:type VI secretion system protein [Thermomonas flagellata]
MNPLDFVERLFSSVGSVFSRIGSLYARGADAARKPWLRWIVVTLVLLLVLAGLAYLALALLPLLPMRFWQVLGLCVVALVVLWWFAAGQRKASLKGRTRKRIGDLGPGNAEDEREPVAKMRAAITEAKRTIARSPEMERGRSPLYRIPWLLFLGEADAGLDGVLRAGAEVSPFPPPAAGPMEPDEVWRWWFFKSMLAIELHPRVVCDANARLDRGLWYQALMMLADEREKLPVNGVVVAVPVQALLGPADALKASATRLRRLVDEAMEHLQVRMPVYFLITGLERLPGYAQVRATLPAEAFAQALGHRLAADEVVSAASSGRVGELFEPIAERLHALRMTALRAQHAPAQRRAVFEFFESLRRCGGGLALLVTQMLEDNPFQRTPRWRGLYFVGGADAAHRGGAFVADLFTRFLPSDQPLAGASLRGSAGRLAVAGLGVLAMLGLSASLAYGLKAARRDDGALLAQTRSACAEVADRTSSGRVAWVASCGRTIVELEAAARQTLLSFGIRRADADIAALQKRVTDDFANLILAPADQMLATDIERRRAGIEHLLAITQRLRLLRDCRSDAPVCREREQPNNVSFDARSRLFAPFTSADHDTRRDRDNAEALIATYLGYLRWQKKNVLDAEQARLEGLLSRLLAQYRPSAEDLRKWADARGPGRDLGTYWLPAGAVVGGDAASAARIPAAYSRAQWEGVVAPLLESLRGADPAAQARVEALREGYFRDYFRAWASFQARFQDGRGLWRGRYPELLARANGPEDPYARFFRDARRDLYELPIDWPLASRWAAAWAEMKASWLASWRPFGRFLAGSVRFGGEKLQAPAWLLAMHDTQARVLAPQAPVFARAYLRLQAEGSGEDAYQLASELFAGKGKADKPPASDYTLLLESVDKPDEKYATAFKGDDLAAWSIVQGPARLLLFLTVHRAGEFVQARWRESVAGPLSALPAQEQVAALYGPQGKLGAFVNDWLKPFITEKERLPVKVAGVAMPLTPAYQGMVASERKFLPVLADGPPFPAGSFTFTRKSDLGALDEAEAGTVLEVDCRERVFRASSAGESLADATAQVFWSPSSCTQARIRIAVAPPAPEGGPEQEFDPATSQMHAAAVPPVVLTAIYEGADGFARLVSDFASGAHAFALEDFRASYSPAQWAELRPRLAQMGFRGARVFLQVAPSDQLQQFLGARGARAEVPSQILE